MTQGVLPGFQGSLYQPSWWRRSALRRSLGFPDFASSFSASGRKRARSGRSRFSLELAHLGDDESPSPLRVVTALGKLQMPDDNVPSPVGVAGVGRGQVGYRSTADEMYSLRAFQPWPAVSRRS